MENGQPRKVTKQRKELAANKHEGTRTENKIICFSFLLFVNFRVCSWLIPALLRGYFLFQKNE